MKGAEWEWVRLTALLFIAQVAAEMMLPSVTSELDAMLATFLQDREERLAAETDHEATGILGLHVSDYTHSHEPPRNSSRAKRSVTDNDRQIILGLHNKLRSQVSPSASNMEYMTWDVELERSAESWASQCLWEHGPGYLLPSIGQNLGVHWGRYRPPTFHVQAWYDEVRDFVYPYPQECNPWCPFRCVGPVCTHYTQVVWATSNKVGCAMNLCINMNVWGQVWKEAVYLVCNYSPKGNWWGHAPYKHGSPCSACPPSYGGGCRDNQCYKADGPDPHYSPSEPEEETNEVERQGTKLQETPSNPWTQTESTRSEYLDANEIINTQQMSQLVSCETKLRDRCKGTTCNRYECPAGCLYSEGKVIGTLHYDMQSSICRAAMHYGVLDNDGGWVDITRQGKKPFFIKSNRNGVQSLGKYRPANSFTISEVPVRSATCQTKAYQMCTFKKPFSHCPRMYCPPNCMEENPHLARVIGTRFYSDAKYDSDFWNDPSYNLGKNHFDCESYLYNISRKDATTWTCSVSVFESLYELCKVSLLNLRGNPSYAYTPRSSICRAAVHAGVIRNYEGGYIDMMPVEKKQRYFGSYQNGIFSESLKNPPGAKAFRIFAII